MTLLTDYFRYFKNFDDLGIKMIKSSSKPFLTITNSNSSSPFLLLLLSYQLEHINKTWFGFGPRNLKKGETEECL